MAFDLMKHEIDRVVTFKNIEYRVLDTLSSGMLLVAKESDVEKGEYPLAVSVIPEAS